MPITLLAKIPNVLVVRKELPATSLKELIAYAKANPGKLTYASQGVGSTAHLSGAQLEALAGIKMVHVPYRGAQPALTDVVAGHVDMFFDTLATSVPLYRDDKVKLLGVADLQRAAAVPEVPTFSEAGLPGFKSITWFGLVAPPGDARRRWPRRSTATRSKSSSARRSARRCASSRSSPAPPRRRTPPSSPMRPRSGAR